MGLRGSKSVVNEEHSSNSIAWSLLGFFVPLALLGVGLAAIYALCMATRSPGPYPPLAKQESKAKQTVAAKPAAPTTVAKGGSAPVIPPAPVKPSIDNTVASAQAGEALYNIYCLACHQAGGIGKVGFAPFIRNHDFLSLASDDFLRQTILTGRPGTAMVAWAHLKEHEIDSLILYLRSEEDPDGPVVAKVDPDRKHPGDATVGQGLYGQYCATCHGQNASGSDILTSTGNTALVRENR